MNLRIHARDRTTLTHMISPVESHVRIRNLSPLMAVISDVSSPLLLRKTAAWKHTTLATTLATVTVIEAVESKSTLPKVPTCLLQSTEIIASASDNPSVTVEKM